MHSQKYSNIGIACGVLLILAGAFVPSLMWVGVIRSGADLPPDLLQSLLSGATVFKINLAVMGGGLVVLSRLNIWHVAAPDAMPLPRAHPRALGVLTAILVVAFALRLYRLDAGLWFDEIATYVNYGHLSLGELITTYDSQNQHLLYSLLASGSLHLFGDSAWALRLPAVLFGVASIGALYLLGRQVGSVREALLSAALLAFSYHHIWFSQNARGYTGLLLWTLLASWLLVRALREEKPQLWLYYALTAALGVYTHMTMLFVIAGHFVIYGIHILRHRQQVAPRWAGFFLGFVVAGILTVLLYAFVLPQILDEFTRSAQAASTSTWQNPLWTLLEIVRAIKVGFAGGGVALVALFVFGIGLWNWLRKDPVVLQLLFFPTIICGGVAIGMGHNLWPRLFFFAMGFGVLVVVRGVFVVGQWCAERLRFFPAARSAWGGMVLCVAMILVSAASIPSVYGPKQDFRGALAYVEQNRKPGDRVVTAGWASYPYSEYFEKDWPGVETPEELSAVRERARRTWLLYIFPPHMEARYPDVLTRIEQDFTVVKRFYGTLGGGTVFVCRADDSPAAASSSKADFVGPQE